MKQDEELQNIIAFIVVFYTVLMVVWLIIGIVNFLSDWIGEGRIGNLGAFYRGSVSFLFFAILDATLIYFFIRWIE